MTSKRRRDVRWGTVEQLDKLLQSLVVVIWAYLTLAVCPAKTLYPIHQETGTCITTNTGLGPQAVPEVHKGLTGIVLDHQVICEGHGAIPCRTRCANLWLFWNTYDKFCSHLNTLSPSQNGRHCPDENFKCIFLNKN